MYVESYVNFSILARIAWISFMTFDAVEKHCPVFLLAIFP